MLESISQYVAWEFLQTQSGSSINWSQNNNNKKGPTYKGDIKKAAIVGNEREPRLEN